MRFKTPRVFARWRSRLGHARQTQLGPSQSRDKCCISGGHECLPRRKRWCDWYQLKTGGYVCGTSDVIAFEDDKLPQVRGIQASREEKLPYQYATVMRRTPLYRKLPDRKTVQAVLHPPAPCVPADSPAEILAAAQEKGASICDIAPDDEESKKALARQTKAHRQAKPEEHIVAKAGPGPEANAQEAEEIEETLDDLAADPNSPVIRWLKRGFHVALDRDFKKDGRKFYRTQESGFIEANALRPLEGSDFHGLEIAAGETRPLGFVTRRKGARAYHQKKTASFDQHAARRNLGCRFIWKRL